MEKKCYMCHLLLDLDKFSNNKNLKDGKQNECKSCHKKYYKESYLPKLEKIRELSLVPFSKVCPGCHIEKPTEAFSFCKGQRDGMGYYCKSCASLKNAQYREKNGEKLRLHMAEWYQNNKEVWVQYNKTNRQKINKQVQIRRKEDLNFRTATNLRIRVSSSVKRGTKNGSAVRDLGCTIPEFIVYIESKFRPGMTWENYGVHGWHYDHITPLSWFDLTNREQCLTAFHYTNYQPLWAKDNQCKSARID
jgi:hypothetical protein